MEKNLMELAEKYCDFKCQTCEEMIKRVSCHTHEESYEVGHRKDCLFNQTIKEGCVIEDN